MKDHVDTLSFGKRVPNSVLQSTTTIADISGYYNSFIRIDESGETEVTFKKNPDLEIPILREALDKFQEPVNLNFKIPEDDKIQKALLHAAYLFCFENFGYEFVYSDSGQLIRNVLVGKENYPINILEINLDHEDALKILPLGLCFISKPFEMQSLVVNIKLINKTTGYACIKMILIPNPNDSGVEDLKTVAAILSKYLGNLEINLLNNFLKMGIQNPYSQMWFNLQNEFGIKKPTI